MAFLSPALLLRLFLCLPLSDTHSGPSLYRCAFGCGSHFKCSPLDALNDDNARLHMADGTFIKTFIQSETWTVWSGLQDSQKTRHNTAYRDENTSFKRSQPWLIIQKMNLNPTKLFLCLNPTKPRQCDNVNNGPKVTICRCTWTVGCKLYFESLTRLYIMF